MCPLIKQREPPRNREHTVQLQQRCSGLVWHPLPSTLDFSGMAILQLLGRWRRSGDIASDDMAGAGAGRI
jgi:hypothetical protein